MNIDDSKKNKDEIDLLSVYRLLQSKRILIFKQILGFIVLGILIAFLLPVIFKSSVTMLPQFKDSGSNKFSGLAALAGVDLTSSATSNEAFYEDVVKSDKLLDSVISKKWYVEEQKKDMFIYDFLEIELDEDHKNPQAKQIYETKVYLREKIITFSTSKENGLMTLSVLIPGDAKLAAELVNYLARQLHLFNESYRQAKALESLNSIKIQLFEAKKELEKVEEELKQFQIKNKSWGNSPELGLDYARLQREVFTESSVYTELRKQYEIAKIDLEKSKETITILDKGMVPVKRDSPKRILIIIVFIFLGLVFAVMYILFTNFINESKK